jgi:catechol 2,3-dioxygenase-like lactoylglutathione lyase family enzyme
MANERTYAILPCKELDESISFYETLGFKRTYQQLRPNPYAVVALEDIQIHLGGITGFNPEDSYGSVIIAVPDPDSLYRTFAAGLRKLTANYLLLVFPESCDLAKDCTVMDLP